MNGPVHRSLLVVDIENSSALDNVELGRTRSTLYRLLDGALTDPETIAAKEDRGDGTMLILAIPVLDVLDHVIENLFSQVRRHNATVEPLTWLRIRVAVHEGYVDRDDNGWGSDALTNTFRICDAKAVKYALENAPRAQGVIVVSDTVYQGVVRHSYRTAVTPSGYVAVTAPTSQGDLQAWVRVPGYPSPPLPEPEPAKTAEESEVHTHRPSSGRTGKVHANTVIGGNVNTGTFVGRDIVGGTP